MERKNPSIAMVACLGFSHLVSLIEFAKRLVFHLPHFHITIFIPTLGPLSPTMHSILQSLPPHIHFTVLPQVTMDDLPPKANDQIVTLISLTMTLSLPSLRPALSSLSSETHLVAMVADVFSVDALEFAKQFNVKSYVYYASTSTSLSFCLHFPKLDEDHEMVSTGFGGLSQPLQLPGCVSFQGNDLIDSVQERSTEDYKTFLRICKRLRFVDGVIVNTFLDLEKEAIIALQDTNYNHPKVYPVGPIIQIGSSSMNKSGSMCLTCLDNQPKYSVIYISFGSTGTISRDQHNELAIGLEMSGHKFLWVVRPPRGSASSDYLTVEKEDHLDHLPEGFIDRTNSQGLMVPSWAPQIEVLRHVSTGGFLTHCGWNSTLESVVCGKPMIAWPLFAEQRMNAIMLTEKLKVAVRPKVDENNNGIVKREEVARVVKSVMEGDEAREIRTRIQVFKDAAANALSEDGSSTRTLSNLAREWKNLSGL